MYFSAMMDGQGRDKGKSKFLHNSLERSYAKTLDKLGIKSNNEEQKGFCFYRARK